MRLPKTAVNVGAGAVLLLAVAAVAITLSEAIDVKVRIKSALGLKLSLHETAHLQVSQISVSPTNAEYQRVLLLSEGVYCGEIASKATNSDSQTSNRFISKANEFVDVSGGVFKAFNKEWETYQVLYESAVLVSKANPVDAKYWLFIRRWAQFCGNPIPSEEVFSRLREILKRNLKDPASATFQSEALNDDSYCGEVNARNALGGYVGYRRFYLLPGKFWQMDGGSLFPLSSGPDVIALTAQINARIEQESISTVAFDAVYAQYCK